MGPSPWPRAGPVVLDSCHERPTAALYLLPEFGTLALEDVTADLIDAYKERLLAERRLSNRTIVRHLTVLHGIFKRAARVWGLDRNPASAELVERPPVRYSGEFRTLTPAEVVRLARHAHDEQHAAPFVPVAFTGLTMPLACENISAPLVPRPDKPEDVDALARRAREFLEYVIAGLHAAGK